MQPKNKRRSYNLGQLIGGLIFTCIFVGLVLLGIFSSNENQFTSSFFEDVANAMQWKQ